MGNRKFRASGPKRVVEKYVAYINESVGNSVAAGKVFTATVSCTVIRTILDLTVLLTGDAATVQLFNGHLVKSPNGVFVGEGLVSAMTEADGRLSSDDELFFFSAAGQREAGAIESSVPKYIFADIKGMRKLEPADVLDLRYIASASTWRIAGTVTIFVKLA